MAVSNYPKTAEFAQKLKLTYFPSAGSAHSAASFEIVCQWPQPQPPAQQPPPPSGGSGPISPAPASSRDTDANTEIARRAGCSQTGQSAPLELMGWSFSNLWAQVGQEYSYMGIAGLPPVQWVALLLQHAIYAKGDSLNVPEPAASVKRHPTTGRDAAGSRFRCRSPGECKVLERAASRREERGVAHHKP